MRIDRLESIVVGLLGPAGGFAKAVPHWRTSEEQMDYARRLCRLLIDRESRSDPRAALGAVEAATGIGKTLGYLVPLLVYGHITGRRTAVATYTLSLLYAMESDALPLATRVVAEEMGAAAPLTFSIRVGISEYVSLDRVSELRCDLPAGHSGHAALEALEYYAADSREGLNSGRLRDWIETGFALPAGITSTQVSLQHWCSSQDKSAYHAQNDRSRAADIMLTTQAAMLMHCLRRTDVIAGQDDLPPIDAVVIDEADRVSSMAEAVAGSHLPIHSLLSVLQGVDNGRRPAIKAARKCLDEVSAMLGAHMDSAGPAIQRQPLHGSKSGPAREASEKAVAVIQAALASLRRLPSVKNDAELLSRLNGWDGQLQRFAAVLGSTGEISAAYLAQSPKRGFLGLGVVAINAGRLLAQLWRREVEDGGVRAVFLTSATLAAPGANGMESFYREVGMRHGEHRLLEAVCGQIEPKDHGHLDIVLADPRAPLPFVAQTVDAVDYEAVVNPAWLDYVSGMISAARAQGGRTLVLCGAYRDTHLLAELLRTQGIDPIEASKGTRQQEIDAFLSQPDGVWLTPAAWEGLDLRDTIKHLVIARVPYRSQEDIGPAALKAILMAKGMDEVVAARIAGSRPRVDVQRKLRQGIGRPLRGRDDRATLWVADARFPLPAPTRDAWLRHHRGVSAGKGDNTLAAVIPVRFRRPLVRIFDINGSLWSAA